MNIQLREIDIRDILPYQSQCAREKVIIKNTVAHVYLIGAYMDNELVGFVGYSIIGKVTIRYKMSYVFPKHRGKGIYALLWNAREKAVSKIAHRYKKINAYCTSKSLPMFLKNSFVPLKEKNKITYVEREIKK